MSKDIQEHIKDNILCTNIRVIGKIGNRILIKRKCDKKKIWIDENNYIKPTFGGKWYYDYYTIKNSEKPSKQDYRLSKRPTPLEKEPTEDKKLMETAKTTKIILVFNNGHEHVLEPEKYKVIPKVDLERLFDIIEQLDHSGIYYTEWKALKENNLREDEKE